VYSGTGGLDGIFVPPGLNYDLTSTGPAEDNIYHKGNFGDYTLTQIGDSNSPLWQLTRKSGPTETIKF